MKNSVSHFEHLLPSWLAKLQFQWVQWVYSLWQIVRGNPLTLLLLTYLPFCLWRLYKKPKAVIALGSTQEYNMSYDEERAYLNLHPLPDLKVLSRTQILDSDQFHCMVEHCGYYYITREDTLCELAKCSQLFGENLVFVERLLPVTRRLAVGKMLSKTEGYEKILSGRYHCSGGSDYIVPTWFGYADLNSKLWGVLSTIPIFLQAKNYLRFSTLLSIVIILLDFNRRWLYNTYDSLFNILSKYVKLNIFKERTELFNFFSLFSNRWKYSDTVKKYAYVTKPEGEVTLACYSKLESPNDIEIISWGKYLGNTSDQFICMEIDKNKAHWYGRTWDVHYPLAALRKPVYVR